REVNPTWKLGLRLLWGPRPYFDYPFNERFSSEALPKAGKPWGYYSLDEWTDVPARAAVANGSAPKAARYPIENHPFGPVLERYFVSSGGALIDAAISFAEVTDAGISNIVTDTGARYSADIFIDASGFAGELIHKRLGEPYVSMREALFCDRAV